MALTAIGVITAVAGAYSAAKKAQPESADSTANQCIKAGSDALKAQNAALPKSAQAPGQPESAPEEVDKAREKAIPSQ